MENFDHSMVILDRVRYMKDLCLRSLAYEERWAMQLGHGLMATTRRPSPNIVLVFRIIRCELCMRMTNANGVFRTESAAAVPVSRMLKQTHFQKHNLNPN
jgi:hypothetical protein